MKVIKQTTSKTVVTIGNFDGLHKGHLKLISKTKQVAAKHNLKSLVCSFNCNTKGSPAIFSGPQLKDCLSSLGMNYFSSLDFLGEIKHLSCKEFAKIFLKERFGACYVVVGEDFRFGTNQSGDVHTLTNLGKQFGFSVIAVKMHNVKQLPLSSTLIRKWLSEGKVSLANRYMYQPFSLMGTVKKGYSAGQGILKVPTANLAMPKNGVTIPFGVYITTTEIEGNTYHSVTNIGYAPTLPKKQPTAETFILDFTEDIYGKRMKINFHQYIRKEKKFSSMGTLKKQIEKDIQACQSYFQKKDETL